VDLDVILFNNCSLLQVFYTSFILSHPLPKLTMIFTPLVVLAAAAATLSMAKTPSGFKPASNVPLTVYFNKVDATNDPVIPQAGK
jgi:hypothetical protein